MKRRDFIRNIGTGIMGASLLSVAAGATSKIQPAAGKSDVVWVENGEPEALLKAALKEMGGIQQFISKGDVVVIKPNIGWDRSPELAANTNPDLVYALVKECINAGAKTVKIFDRTCNNSRRCYLNSQIQKRAEEAGADVSQIRDNRFVEISIPNGKLIKSWSIYKDYLEADKVINVPIAKHHSLSRVSLGMKNLMGVMGGSRGSIHSEFTTKMVDIVSAILPTLTIIDGYRILTANGPVGGDPRDVKLAKTLIASTCIVAADSEALKLFGHTLNDVAHVKEAIDRGVSKFDMKNLTVKKIQLS